MPELICHLFGDYVFQNQWMADHKTRSWRVAAVHALVYSLMFLVLCPSLPAWLVIFGTHLVIDRFRLAGYWCRWYGIGRGVPDWLQVWLVIIVDNAWHLLINHLALRYL